MTLHPEAADARLRSHGRDYTHAIARALAAAAAERARAVVTTRPELARFMTGVSDMRVSPQVRARAR
jgi:hypothetical protein